MKFSVSLRSKFDFHPILLIVKQFLSSLDLLPFIWSNISFSLPFPLVCLSTHREITRRKTCRNLAAKNFGARILSRPVIYCDWALIFVGWRCAQNFHPSFTILGAVSFSHLLLFGPCNQCESRWNNRKVSAGNYPNRGNYVQGRNLQGVGKRASLLQIELYWRDNAGITRKFDKFR